MCSALTYDNIYMQICICVYVCAYTHTQGSECRKSWPCSMHRSPRYPESKNTLSWAGVPGSDTRAGRNQSQARENQIF